MINATNESLTVCEYLQCFREGRGIDTKRLRYLHEPCAIVNSPIAKVIYYYKWHGVTLLGWTYNVQEF